MKEIKKKKKIKRFGIVALTICFLLTVCSGCAFVNTDNTSSGKDSLPPALKEVVDNTENIAGETAETLSGEWGDVYKHYSDFMHAGGNEEKAEDWEYLHDTLYELQRDSEAKWMWVMEPKDGKGDIDGVPFYITMDGFSPDPEDSEYWWTIYDSEEPWDPAFRNAWNGKATSTTWAYTTYSGKAMWTGCAPVYDSEKNVVCILIIEVPVNGLADYPEWDGDSVKFEGPDEW